MTRRKRFDFHKFLVQLKLYVVEVLTTLAVIYWLVHAFLREVQAH